MRCKEPLIGDGRVAGRNQPSASFIIRVPGRWSRRGSRLGAADSFWQRLVRSELLELLQHLRAALLVVACTGHLGRQPCRQPCSSDHPAPADARCRAAQSVTADPHPAAIQRYFACSMLSRSISWALVHFTRSRAAPASHSRRLQAYTPAP
jgi:hypothetical protein